MKKLVLLAIISIFIQQTLYAQSHQKELRKTSVGNHINLPSERKQGKINGILLDQVTDNPLKFAAVTLINQATRTIIAGTQTDEKGKFRIGSLASGQYMLSINPLGYEIKIIDSLTIAKGEDEVNVGVLALKPDVTRLKEVTVTREGAGIEDQTGNFGYNSNETISIFTGEKAAEIMRQEPCSNMDMEALVQLGRSAKIEVFINNKPTAIMASRVEEALFQIPAGQIKTIEISTSSPAKKDVPGSIMVNVTKDN